MMSMFIMITIGSAFVKGHQGKIPSIVNEFLAGEEGVELVDCGGEGWVG